MPDIIKKIKNPELYIKFDNDKCPNSIQLLVNKILKSDPEH